MELRDGPAPWRREVKRTQRKYVQKAYRVRNWREYETGLRARGSLTVWLGLTDGVPGWYRTTLSFGSPLTPSEW